MNMTNHLIENDIKSMDNVHYINIFNEMLTTDGMHRPELYVADNLHMNEQGYAIWTRAVNQYLQTNGFISKGLSNYEVSVVLLIFSLLVSYINFA